MSLHCPCGADLLADGRCADLGRHAVVFRADPPVDVLIDTLLRDPPSIPQVATRVVSVTPRPMPRVDPRVDTCAVAEEIVKFVRSTEPK